MKVTPLDLRQTHLSTSLRGYDRDEVRTLLTDAADDYEAALRELDRLRQDLQKVETQLGEHRDREANLRNTLLTAQKVADQIRENAGKESEVLLRDAEGRSAAMLKDAETRSTAMLKEADLRAATLTAETEAKVRAMVDGTHVRTLAQVADADTRSQATLRDADARAEATLREATARAQVAISEAQLRADAMVKDAQTRVDVLLQKANARLDEFEHAVSEMRLRKRDVEGTLEQSIASLTYALEFVRTQDARDDKVRMLRPRQNDASAEAARIHGGEAAMLG